jgi:multicomponent Na+:H+ antiporter subunit E
MKKTILPIVILTIIFLLFTEQLTIINVVAGIAIAVLIYWMNREEIQTIRFFKFKTIGLWLMYITVLLKEVLVANVQVARIVLTPKMPIAPRIVTYKTSLNGSMMRTILANSITLTPGTMSVDLEDRTFRIHCLSDTYAASLEGNVFEKMLMRIEEANNG